MAIDGLKVAKGDLSSWGDALVKTGGELDTKLDTINENMATIQDSWKDNNGQSLVEKYSAFMTDAKVINSQLVDLGNKVNKFVSLYNEIESKYASMME